MVPPPFASSSFSKVYFLTSQPHILFLNHHFKITSPSIDNTCFYSKVSIVLLLFVCDVQSLGPAAYLPWPGLDYLWPTIRLTMLHVHVFYLCLILHSACGVIHPCIDLLWFYTESFVIATVKIMVIIGALLHIWTIRLIIIVCWVSAPDADWCLCFWLCKLVLKVLLSCH